MKKANLIRDYLLKNPPKQNGDYDRIARLLDTTADNIRYHSRMLGLNLRAREETEMKTIKVKQSDIYQVVPESWETKLGQNKIYSVDLSKFYGKKLRFGVISDTHLGSRHQQITFLHEAYRVYDKEEVEFVVCAGDITEGNGSHYPGQIQELFLFTFDDQLRYAVEALPRLKSGKPTYFITGDHDLDWFKAGGRDIGEAIGELRSDWVYCGQVGAYLTVGSRNRKFIYLHHPRGGTAYAKSYKAQKWIEAVAPENKPQIYINGHFHSNAFYMFTRNVHCIDPGCLQSQTPFLAAQGVEVILSFVVAEISLDSKGGVTSLNPRYFYEFVPKRNDYPHFQFQKVIPPNETKIG